MTNTPQDSQTLTADYVPVLRADVETCLLNMRQLRDALGKGAPKANREICNRLRAALNQGQG